VVVWVMVVLITVGAVAVGGLAAKLNTQQHRTEVAQGQARDALVRERAAVADAQAAEADAQTAQGAAQVERQRADKGARDLSAARADSEARRRNQLKFMECLSGVFGSYTAHLKGRDYVARDKWLAVEATCRAAIDESNVAGPTVDLDEI
jgi:hypothetical protein